jgi:hypothetical protein
MKGQQDTPTGGANPRGKPAPTRQATTELVRTFLEAGFPAEMAEELDAIWRQNSEERSQEPAQPTCTFSAAEIAALEPVFLPLWKSRWGSITWAEMLDALLSSRPTRSRRDPQTKRAKEKLRSLLRRLPANFWCTAAAGIDDLKTLDPQLKDRLLSICRNQAGRARKARKRAGRP